MRWGPMQRSPQEENALGSKQQSPQEENVLGSNAAVPTGGECAGVQAAVPNVLGTRDQFAGLPAAHFLLCGLVPNRPRTGTGGWGLLV